MSKATRTLQGLFRAVHHRQQNRAQCALVRLHLAQRRPRLLGPLQHRHRLPGPAREAGRPDGDHLQARVTMYTTIWGAEAAAEGIRNLGELVVYPIQALHEQLH